VSFYDDNMTTFLLIQLLMTHEYPDPEDVAGLTRCAPPPPFIPKFCTLDKKVLRWV
jgi:hypothetical protein